MLNDRTAGRIRQAILRRLGRSLRSFVLGALAIVAILVAADILGDAAAAIFMLLPDIAPRRQFGPWAPRRDDP